MFKILMALFVVDEFSKNYEKGDGIIWHVVRGLAKAVLAVCLLLLVLGLISAIFVQHP